MGGSIVGLRRGAYEEASTLGSLRLSTPRPHSFGPPTALGLQRPVQRSV